MSVSWQAFVHPFIKAHAYPVAKNEREALPVITFCNGIGVSVLSETMRRHECGLPPRICRVGATP